MRSSMLMCVLLILPLAFTATGCQKKKAPAPPGAAARIGAAEQLFGGFDADQPNQPIKPLKKPSNWRATGKDDWGNTWEGYLVIDTDPDNHMRLGYFEWRTEPAGARYHFEGTFDPVTRVVRWTAYNMEERIVTATMRPRLASYEATLSENGLRLVNGRWWGGGSIPGKWTADCIDAN